MTAHALAPRCDRLVWERDGGDWPHRDTSRFVPAGGVRWHVQRAGSGPLALLVHGTGASTHSWRDVVPLLARAFDVVALDLPGHGFSSALARGAMSLPAIAAAVAALLAVLDVTPEIVVGHSAGAAILARMILDGRLAPRALVSFNGAFLPLGGVPGRVFSPAAKLLAAAPFVPHWVTRRARDPRVIRGLVTDMGSALPDDAIAWYARLGGSAAHVGAALSMMASWNLHPLGRDLPRLGVPLTLVVGDRDRAIPPSDAERVARLVPGAVVAHVADAGHLAHEERPDIAARIVLEAAQAAVILGARSGDGRAS